MRRRKFGARIVIERDEVYERTVRNHHAGGVGACVAVKALQRARDLYEFAHARVCGNLFIKFRLARYRLIQRRRFRRIERDQFRETVNLAVRHLHHAADIAHHGLGLQRTEGDDHRHAVSAVLVAHITNDFAAPLLAEVDVEVRHRDAFGVEKSLEEQIEPDGVEVRDQQRPGDERAGARAAARADGNAIRLGPFDEVRNDQEVAREPHALNDTEFEVEPLEIGVALRIQTVRFLEAEFETLPGLNAELFRLRAPAIAETRQDGAARLRLDGATPGDFHR